MGTLSLSGERQHVNLIYSNAAPDDGFIREVHTAAASAGVHLQGVDTKSGGLVDLAMLAKWVPQWRDTDVWFCGRSRFGDSTEKTMIANGLPSGRFHWEFFEMR